MALQRIYGILFEPETNDIYKITNTHNYLWFYIHDTKGIDTIDGSETKERYLIIDLRKPVLSN